MEHWATDKLSIFLGLDTLTLETQVIPYLMTLDTPDALTQHLTDMLGTSSDCLDFIYEFANRRFTQKQPKVQTSSQSSKGLPFPSLPAGEVNSQWPANINIHDKSNDEMLFSGSRKPKKQNKPKASSSSSDKQQQQKKKKEMTLETALKELDIKAGDGKRKPCQCQATKHPLLDIAPNCLNCGKIICTLEGPGPCTFCGTEVLSKEQEVHLISEAKKKRAELKNQQNQQQQPRRVKNPVRKHGYASMLSGDFGSGQTTQEEEEAQRRAEEHKEKLLSFQKTSSKRNTVIDQAADLVLPIDQASSWASPQERASMLKKQQANLRRIEKADQPRRRVMTLDIKTKQVRLEEMSDTDEESAEEEEEEVAINRSRESSSGGTFANNPLLKDLKAPTFVRKSKASSSKQSSGKKGIQLNNDDVIEFKHPRNKRNGQSD
ncbi:putative zinc finger motif, C2HC5-type-domain-containing protein [Phycomyces blakesleeanus]|uniref:TRIP4/RQT4 C2HC5-type zinc finger domain-containing protein n=2 Tax=Phycomyces blakesleeanus TaxID=4837 RepID=A0A167QWV4_PHYB8|nr:hypothetical protein PHYBLDRAFT_137964 [Phycomyces blakesleeanus NRRL 1555(-)]OAD80408.1 hypothetical protein PHYBLDRAFT_137964 [Phycomyces blakesleeanus NRRL 1555(-)]|eukprot:XP_018298448.1 hypothetical protein PHYBLDRAFT_137964 [Phycomyces blakesleeanus NRRL 1555(-)]